MVMCEAVSLLILLLSFPDTSNGNFHGAGTWNLKDVRFENVTHMDLLSRKAMKVMHDVLDEDNDGNVSLKEGDKFLAGNKDLVESTGENAKLPGFETDTDGRITETEFWDSWIKSNVHNWTNEQIVSWLKYDVEMPQYANNFKIYNISGAAFPILACNSSIVSAIVEGSKENRLKLMLKAKEIVLFGPSKQGSNWMKDVLLTFSLALALSGIAFGMHVQRTANQTILAIQEKMKALQKSVDTMEEEDEFEWHRDTKSEDDVSAGSNSTEGDDMSAPTFSVNNDEMYVQGKLAEVMRELDSTKEALQNTEKLLQSERNSFEIPDDLLTNLKATYQVETSLFEMKKKQVYDNVEHTKSQFQKLQRNRSTIIGVLQFMHSRQIDNFDSGVEQTREEFRVFQNIKKERRRRWMAMEQICKCKFISGSTRSRFSPNRSESFDLLEPSDKNLEQNLSVRKRGERLKKSPLLHRNQDIAEKSSIFDYIGSKNSPKASTRLYAISSHSSSPALHAQMSEAQYQGNNEKKHVSKITHSESISNLPSSSSGSLQPIPEKTFQTFPKRSPQPRRRRELSNLLDKSEEIKQDSAVVRNGRESSSEDSSSLDQAQRTGSAHSLPHLFNSETNSVKDSSQIAEHGEPLHNKNSDSEETHSSPMDKARKINLKKRTFFTFKKKKK